MKLINTYFPGVFVIEPPTFYDNRGFFIENFNEEALADLGINCKFVIDSHSHSKRNVVRGLHYQLGKPQAKLVRVTNGEVFDVVVDVRVGSPTFGKVGTTILSSENKRMLFIPEGFAHGFSVISETAEFAYKCSDYRDAQEERGIAWNDPDLAINWPLNGKSILSEKDTHYGPISALKAEDFPSY